MTTGHGIPTVRAEIALTTDPLTRPGALDWTDFSTRDLNLLTLKTVRGAPVKVPGIETGTATAVVTDDGRVLDDTNAASPWYGNYDVRRRIRFYVDPANGAESVIYTGFVERTRRGWRLETATATITAADLFSVIAGTLLPPSVLDVEIRATAPLGYWPMTETAGLYADNVLGTLDGYYRRSVTTASAAPFDKRANVVCKRRDKNDQAAQLMTAVMPGGLTAVSMFMVYRWQPGAILSDNIAVCNIYNNGTGYINLELRPVGDGTHKIRVWVSDTVAAASVIADTAAMTVMDGAPHTIGFAIDTSEAPKIYFDGVEYTPTLASGSAAWSSVDTTRVLSAATEVRFGWGITFYNDYTTMDPNTAAVGHGTIWDRIVTSGEFATLHNAAMNPWDDDLTGTRLGRVLDIVGVDPLDRDIAVGTQTCGPTFLASENTLQYLRKIAATEGAALFVDPDGKIRLRERTGDDPAPLLIVSDDPTGDGGVPYFGDLAMETSVDRIVNVAEVTREAGTTVRVVDQASVDRYGERSSTSVATLDPSPRLARLTGHRVATMNSSPRGVFEEFEIHGRDAAVGLDAVLSRELGDPVRVIARPPGGGLPVDQVCLLERIEQTLDGTANWVTKYNAAKHVNFPPVVPLPVPTFVSASTAVQTVATTSHPVTKPASLAVGDVLIAVVQFAAGNIAVTAPAGWTVVDRPTTNAESLMYRRTVDGTEGATFTWGTGGVSTKSAVAVMAIRGAVAVQDQHEWGFSATTTLTSPQITPSVEASLLIAVFTANSDATTTFAFTTPTGMTVRATAAGSTSPAVMIATEELTDPDATGTRSSTLTGGPGAGYGYSVNFYSPPA